MHRTNLSKSSQTKGAGETARLRRRVKQLVKTLTELIRRAKKLERKYARSKTEAGRQGVRVLAVILRDARNGLLWLQKDDNLEKTAKRVLLLLMWLEFLLRTLG